MCQTYQGAERRDVFMVMAHTYARSTRLTWSCVEGMTVVECWPSCMTKRKRGLEGLFAWTMFLTSACMRRGVGTFPLYVNLMSPQTKSVVGMR